MIQKKTTGLMTLNFREGTRPLFEALSILNIYELNIYLIGHFM